MLIAWQISGSKLCIAALLTFEEYEAVLLIVGALIIVLILKDFVFFFHY
jgi:hypothetical protein